MSRRSRFTYGTQALDFELPAQDWIPGDSTVGGVRISAAGVPATYIVRRDGLLDLALRFHESEWVAVQALVVYGQSGLPLTWYPDADDLGSSIDVYLQAPAPGEKWQPTRNAQFPRVMLVTLTLRGVAAAPWLPFFS